MTNKFKGLDFNDATVHEESTMKNKCNWGNFNDAPDQVNDFKYDLASLKDKLILQLPAVLMHLFPAGKFQGKQFMVGSLKGEKGKSLVVELAGKKPGVWIDFATSDKGDILHAWAAVMTIDHKNNFPELVESVAKWLGEPDKNNGSTNQNAMEAKSSPPISHPTKNVYIDELGSPSAKWDYWDSENNLIACVYRYDTPEGKQYRPWDVKARAKKAPDPRPLYNQLQIVKSDQVILVEGEKSADALINKGIVATTAMNGANAPVDKTDWSPLKNKHVLIWPDHDVAGQQYADRAASAISDAGASSVTILQIPSDKPEKWDAFDAVEDGIDINEFIYVTKKQCVKKNRPIPYFRFGELVGDRSPMPDDLIAPRVLTLAGMVVFGGAPKVGKSDFLLSWLVHMAAGAPFLKFTTSRPLRIFYLQSEIQYDYLRERSQQIKLPQSLLDKVSDNLYITPQLHLILNEHGTKKIIETLKSVSADEGKIDILVIDPIRNMFDGGPEGNSENDNNAMQFFLQQRVGRIRNAINPTAGIILVHHTKKIFKKQLEENPFDALSGASSLRSYYTTGMLLYRPDENFTDRRLMIELRNGAPLPTMCVDKHDGKWVQVDSKNPRLIQKEYGAKHDAERIRKNNVIVQLIFDEAAKGHVYTANQFANAFEGKAGLGGNRTIVERLGVLTTKGYIKFFRNPKDYGLPPAMRSKYGYLCTEEMVLYKIEHKDNGEIIQSNLAIKPTHYKCPQSGALLPVENPDVWVYQEELNHAA